MSAVLEEEQARAAAPQNEQEPQGHPRRWWILAVILIVECMDLLDGTIVNVAAPSIRTDLHASLSALQWIAGGYALAFAIGLVTGGRLGDIFGRRKLFLIGVAGFTTASVLCGLATSPEMLIGFRLLQGLFAASMIPQGFGILRQVFPPSELQKAFGFFGPVIGLSAVAGPVIGGALTDGNLFGLGWRAIFLVNLPLGIIALISAAKLLPESKAENKPTLDLAGAALVSLAAALLIYPLIQGREAGWPLWTYASIAASLGALVAFVIVERRRERENKSPLVTMGLFRKRAFSAGLAIALVFFAGVIGVMLTFSLYLQLGEGFSAIGTGVAMIPLCLGVAVGAAIGNAVLGPKFGRPTLHIGIAVMALGIAGLILTSSHGASAWALAGPEFLTGAGLGAALSPLFDFVLAGVEDDEVGSASGVLNAMQQLGGSIGIAVLGTIFFSVAAGGALDGAFHATLWVVLGLLVITAVLVGALPMHARQGEHA